MVMIDMSVDKQSENIASNFKVQLDKLNESIKKLKKYYDDVTIAWNDDYGKSYLTKVKTYIDELNKIYSGLTIEYKCMSNLFNSFETVDKEIQNIINRTTGI